MVAAVPDPIPSNNDITRVTISGLTSGNTYSITVWCISQAGIASAVPATLSWQVVPSAPDAVAIDKPDANSGSAQPMFTFGVQWVNSSVPTGAVNITFQVGVHAVFVSLHGWGYVAVPPYQCPSTSAVFERVTRASVQWICVALEFALLSRKLSNTLP